MKDRIDAVLEWYYAMTCRVHVISLDQQSDLYRILRKLSMLHSRSEHVRSSRILKCRSVFEEDSHLDSRNFIFWLKSTFQYDPYWALEFIRETCLTSVGLEGSIIETNKTESASVSTEQLSNSF